MAKKATTDPIFAKIAEYERAEEIFSAAIADLDKATQSGDKRRIKAAKKREDLTSDAGMNALKRMCRMHPRTTAGLIAKMDSLSNIMNETIDGLYCNGAVDGLWDHLRQSVERLTKAA